MQETPQDTVLGDFTGSNFAYNGLNSTFFKRDDRFYVNTDGPDGSLEDFEITYAFGVDPLQQYLIEFPDGRLQALGIAWDTRPADDGGQHWFHLYPDEDIDHTDPLHWTGANQTWNYMCAECHSTNLDKNYDPIQNLYDTTWSEIDVACEACHGPASRHVDWARTLGGNGEWPDPDKGLQVALRSHGEWIPDAESGTARRSMPLASNVELETCGRCHARRSVFDGDYVHGKPLLDTHLISLLDDGLYHADGQIDEEVYVYGSFLQSKMHGMGVTCTDCHNPHSLQLKAPGDAVCMTCHQQEKYATVEHHFHKLESGGASCVACHMPTKTYMVLDERHDHSIRIPRPDLTIALGTPNACTACHADKTEEWAVAALSENGKTERSDHFGVAIHAGRMGLADAELLLSTLANDPGYPGIARATAASLLPGYLSPNSLDVLLVLLHDPDPLVRAAAVRGIDLLEPRVRLVQAAHLLEDPVRAVRLEAARALADVPQEAMTTTQRAVLSSAIAEYIAAQTENADRAFSHANLALLHTRLGRLQEAESAYREAMKRESGFVPAYVNLADLYRLQGRETEEASVLSAGLNAVPDTAELHHAWGLLQVRRKLMPEALTALAEAVRLAPNNTRFTYVYAVALHTAGEVGLSLRVLGGAHERRPADRDVLSALIQYNRIAGDIDSALSAAQELAKLTPWDPQMKLLLETLEASR